MSTALTLAPDDVLDLAGDPRFATPIDRPARLGPRGAWMLALAFAALLALVLVATGPGFAAVRTALGWSAPDAAAIRLPLDQQRMIATLTVDDTSQIVVQGADAEARNAAIPLSGLPLEKVRSVLIAGGANASAGTYDTALKCLTQAVYYEAANEPLAGRRAVAQVILNRMRHPAYPHSVCGVVYQGAERATGCQFSFTCDGSLLRAPMARPWREAAEVARQALAGHVEPEVGTATHYHADYVLPKWAFTLGKIEQIGRHIFYRFNGGWGRANAFNLAYSGVERIPALDLLAQRQRREMLMATAPDAAPVFADGLSVAPHPADRHAANDVGGRIDVAKTWRLAIPDPTQASSGYRSAIEAQAGQGTATVRDAAAPLPATVVAKADAVPAVGG